MPKYKNNTSTMIVLPNGEISPVAAGAVAETKGYLRDANGLTLIDHDVSRVRPFIRLFASALSGATNVSNLELYDSILVKNFSGNELTVTPNGDSSNPMVMADNEIMTFVNKSPSGRIEWNYMTLTGSGTDPVYVYGYKEE